jgi:hypothetical protein
MHPDLLPCYFHIDGKAADEIRAMRTELVRLRLVEREFLEYRARHEGIMK